MENTIINIPSEGYTISYVVAAMVLGVIAVVVSAIIGLVRSNDKSPRTLVQSAFPGLMLAWFVTGVASMAWMIGAPVGDLYLKTGLPAEVNYHPVDDVQAASAVTQEAFDAQVVDITKSRGFYDWNYTWQYVIKDADGQVRQCDVVIKGKGTQEGIPAQLLCGDTILSRTE